jgi:hypothetical protein
MFKKIKAKLNEIKKCDSCECDPKKWTYLGFVIDSFWLFIQDFTSSTITLILSVSLWIYLWNNWVSNYDTLITYLSNL